MESYHDFTSLHQESGTTSKLGVLPKSCYNFIVPLSETQEAAIATLDWLYSADEEDRRTGRTFSIAIALIRRAARYPGTRVSYMTDHQSARISSSGYMRSAIEYLVREDPQLNVYQRFQQYDFSLNLPTAIENWRPWEWSSRPPCVVACEGPLDWNEELDQPECAICRRVVILSVWDKWNQRPNSPQPKTRWDRLLDVDELFVGSLSEL